MGFFNVVQAPGRPDSFPIATGITFQRGVVGLLDTSGNLTTTISSTKVLGLVDDQKSTSNEKKVVDDTYIVHTVSVTNGATCAFTYSTGKTLSAAITNAAAGSTTAWELWYRLESAPTAALVQLSTNVSFAMGTTGTITVTLAAGHGLSTASYEFHIIASYSYVVPNPYLGATNVVDMYGNDSTLGTTVASTNGLASVYFLQGIYETDQFDPTVAYVPGDFLYVLEGGILTTDANASVYQESSADCIVGIVLKAPSAALTADQVTVSGHATPFPTALRLMWNGRRG